MDYGHVFWSCIYFLFMYRSFPPVSEGFSPTSDFFLQPLGFFSPGFQSLNQCRVCTYHFVCDIMLLYSRLNNCEIFVFVGRERVN